MLAQLKESRVLIFWENEILIQSRASAFDNVVVVVVGGGGWSRCIDGVQLRLGFVELLF